MSDFSRVMEMAIGAGAQPGPLMGSVPPSTEPAAPAPTPAPAPAAPAPAPQKK